MRTRVYWTLCCAASMIIAAAATSLAQDALPKIADPESARQVARQRADIYAARQAAGAPPSNANAPSLNPYAQTAPSGIGRNNQQLFAAGQFGGYSASAFPGFDPELAKVNNSANQSIMELVKKIKEAESEEVKLELKAEVKQLLDEQYDAYLTHHEAPLKKLEERLKKLRTEFESRKKAKDDLVKLRLDTIWYDALGLGWPDSRRSGNGFSSWRQPNGPMARFWDPALVPKPSTFAPPAGVPTSPAIQRKPKVPSSSSR